MALPGHYPDASGDCIHRSPLVTGSGCENMVEPGDSAIVFIDSIGSDPSVSTGLIRMEPLSELDALRLELTAVGGP